MVVAVGEGRGLEPTGGGSWREEADEHSCSCLDPPLVNQIPPVVSVGQQWLSVW